MSWSRRAVAARLGRKRSARNMTMEAAVRPIACAREVSMHRRIEMNSVHASNQGRYKIEQLGLI